MRENDVRTQVSGARSAQKESGLISSAVRQTPLTATLWPVPSSFGVCFAADGDAAVLAALLDAGDAADFFHYACEHEGPPGERFILSYER